MIWSSSFGYSLIKPSKSLLVTKQTIFNASRNLPPIKPSTLIDAAGQERIQNLLKFIDNSPEPYHVVDSVSKYLANKGFTKISDSMLWRSNNILKRGGKYYLTQNDSTILAFVIGNKFNPGNGFKLIGAHTDSPNLRLKPKSKRSSNKMIQLNVECYGGGLIYHEL